MAIAGIPEVINDFNLYNTGNRLIGTTGEVSLPDFEAITATVSGNGILGEFEAPVTGHFSGMELEVPFRCIDPDYFTLVDTRKSTELTLRGAIQVVDPSTHDASEIGMRVVARGRCKKIAPGTVKQREAMDSSISLDLTFYMVEMDGKERIRLDKLNGEFKINGEDMLASIHKLT
ncbi:MAG: phage major tail tube protein [Oscillospiraceae bacterium]